MIVFVYGVGFFDDKDDDTKILDIDCFSQPKDDEKKIYSYEPFTYLYSNYTDKKMPEDGVFNSTEIKDHKIKIRYIKPSYCIEYHYWDKYLHVLSNISLLQQSGGRKNRKKSMVNVDKTRFYRRPSIRKTGKNG